MINRKISKNLVTICLMIFVIVVIGILSVAVFLKPQTQTSQQVLVGQSGTSPSVVMTLVDVAKHNSQNDCWVVVSGNVYNVTSIIPIHTGGANAIISQCGKDATVAFDTKYGRGSHSQRAQDILNNLYVGRIN